MFVNSQGAVYGCMKCVNNCCVLSKLNSPEQARVLIASELFSPLLRALATTR